MINNSMMTTFHLFSDKMIFSTSKEDKRILLWDEKAGTVAYTYEDENIKTFIPRDKLLIIGKNLYSEYFLNLQENKSVISIWKTNSSTWTFKFSLTEEKITSMDISQNDKLLFLSTTSGILLIYELSSGCLLGSVKLSTGMIHDIKCFYSSGSVILCLCEDGLKMYYTGRILNSKEQIIDEVGYGKILDPVREAGNYEESYEKIISNVNHSLIAVYKENKNKIALHSFPKISAKLKTFYFDEDAEINRVIFDDSSDSDNLLFSYKTSIYSIDVRLILKSHSDLQVISYSLGNTLAPIIEASGKISTFTKTGGAKQDTIITGHEDGKMIIWTFCKKSYTQYACYNLHKGAVTNIISANRPISQYGLNFNNTVEEVIVSRLQTQFKEYSHSNFVKNSMKNEDNVESYLDKLIEKKKQYATLATEFILSGNDTNNSVKKHGQVNLDDPSFLKKKLNELYELLNK